MGDTVKFRMQTLISIRAVIDVEVTNGNLVRTEMDPEHLHLHSMSTFAGVPQTTADLLEPFGVHVALEGAKARVGQLLAAKAESLPNEGPPKGAKA